MIVRKLNSVMRALTLSIVAGAFLAGCGSSGSDSGSEPLTPLPTEPSIVPDTGSTPGLITTSDFDGSWSNDCFADRIIGIPETAQTTVYVQQTLAIDTSVDSYSVTTSRFTDSQCITVNTAATVTVNSGDILFDGVTTTRTGLEASVVRYFNNGSSPDYTGLLYRDGDVLFRDPGPGTTIEEASIPDQLILSSPWRLNN